MTAQTETVVRPLKPGIYAPIPTFFLPESEDLDIPTFESHVLHIARSGTGILLCGSMGEAHHLTPTERTQLIKAARATLDKANLAHVPIIAGTGAGSTRETLELTKQAAEAGADYSIVIASGYFAGAMDKRALKAFWTEVADKSPIPVMIYNYPGAAGGIELDSDIIEELARESANICGVKLTCGNVGKLTRIAATTAIPSFTTDYPRRNPAAPFLTLGGFADFILSSTFARAHGAIVGLGNVAPYTLTKLFELSQKAVTDPTLLQEALRLQDVAARGDRTIALAGIAGTKFLLSRKRGYGGNPRRPLLPLLESTAETLWAHPNVVELLRVEAELEAQALGLSAPGTPVSTKVSPYAPASVVSDDSEETNVDIDAEIGKEETKLIVTSQEHTDVPPETVSIEPTSQLSVGA